LIKAILWLIGLTFVPALELRASIPVGVFGIPERLFGLDLVALGAPVNALGQNGIIAWWWVVLVCIVSNIILGWLVFCIMAPVFTFIRKWKWFDGKIWPILERTQHKIHPYVEKYGELGVAVFIGIPLPGSGVYTGAFGSYLLGLDKRKFFIANIIGVLIAATAVTCLCLLVLKGAVEEGSWLTEWFLKLKHNK
jgi:uncharacterized membrane protein